MRYVITGGAGFVGSHLCERLVEVGHEVVCVDNLVTGVRSNVESLCRQPTFEFLQHDVVDPIELDGPVDVVIHLASPASPKDYLALPLETMRTGSIGTENYLKLALSKSAKFLLASTSEVYGDPEKHPQAENYLGNVNPVGPRAVYDEAKRYAEAMTAAYHRTLGLDTRIARIFNTYGPRMRPLDGRVVSGFIVQALTGQPLTVFGTGGQTRSFCYVSDLVDGLLGLIECPYTGPVNLGNPAEFTVSELAKLVIEMCQASAGVSYLPLPEDDPARRQPDIDLANRLFGFAPRVSLAEGLAITIDHFRQIIAR